MQPFNYHLIYSVIYVRNFNVFMPSQLGPGTQEYNISTRSLKLSDVIGAWIAKRRLPSNPSKEGHLVGFTLFTFSKAGNRKLCEARVTFESDDESVCEAWIEKINDIIQG